MKTVLIVEDYESIRGLYADAFLRAGLNVDTALSGAEALKKIKEQKYEYIVLDILMLELSGLEFLKSFNAKSHPATVVVVVSNLDSPAIIKKATDLGAAKYLIKSQYTPKQLVAEVIGAAQQI